MGKVTGCYAGHIHQNRCHTRGESQGMYIMYASTKVQIRLPTLILKHRGDVIRSLKQRYQCPPPKWTCAHYFFCLAHRLSCGLIAIRTALVIWTCTSIVSMLTSTKCSRRSTYRPGRTSYTTRNPRPIL